MTDTPHDEAVTAHDGRVRRIAEQIRQAAATKQRPHVSKGGQHHVVPLPGDTRFRGPSIDTSDLNHLMEVDVRGQTFTAEPGLTFEDLVAATLPHGLIPMLVPELKGITVGGAVAGCSVESMSYRYGGFHDSALEYELVSGDGRIVTLTPDDHDLFQMIHGSYGTLGVLTKVTARLIPARQTVRVEYRRHRTFEDFSADLVAMSSLDRIGPPEFIDGIVHAPDNLVLVLGTFIDDEPPPPERWLTPYFVRSRNGGSEVFRTEDYLFRYDADCHWLTRVVPPLQKPLVRRLVRHRLLGSTRLIQTFGMVSPIMSRLQRRPDLVCDIFVTLGRFGDFFRWYTTHIDDWPLWVVPYRPPLKYPWISKERREMMADDLFVDCAVYGAPNNDKSIDLSVELENAVFDLGGIKTLIGRNHYTEERFWQVYDRDNHMAAKAALDPDGLFPDLATKYRSIG